MKKFRFTLGISLIYLTLVAQQDYQSVFTIRGQVMTDIGYNFNQVNPDYFDVMRPTQLPAFKNQWGTDGNTYFGVRQSMLDIIGSTQTRCGELQTRFAFDMFGVGVDAGQTTFHLLYAYAELGMIGAGFNWGLFCDFDGFPNSIDYWGPAGMSLCKNAQIRFIPLNGRNRLAFALEKPGASADQGVYRDRIELADVKPKFDVPDFTAEFRVTRNWGYAELAGAVRKIEWVDEGSDAYDLSGKAYGWGFNFSTNLKLSKKSLFIGQTAIGEGIQNFMNDAPTDIGVENNFGNPNAPVKGVALPIYGYMAYINHQWNEKFTSILGYSAVKVDNSNAQSTDAFRHGRFASTNLLYKPYPNITSGVELIWINRENYKDGWTTSGTKIQISLRYSFKEEIKK